MKKYENLAKNLKKTIIAGLCLAMAGLCLSGCGKAKETEITVFAAKSLNNVMDELCASFTETHPNIKIYTNYDSSGTLRTQIKEGAQCQLFFSAGVSQMKDLQAGYTGGHIAEGSPVELLNNRVCLVTYKGSTTKVTGFDTLSLAADIALADGSVPVGAYTRKALVNAGMVEDKDNNPAALEDTVISAALGGVEINTCANVGAVAAAVSQGDNEIGTVYYSDTFGYEGKLEILEILPNSLTGDVIYPAAVLVGDNDSKEQTAAAEELLRYLQSEEAAAVFEKYYFDVK